MSNTLSIPFAYTLPVLTTAWLLSPLSVVQGIYAKYYGISLSTIAYVVLISRMFDAITDPLIGYYSDHYWQRHGTRKPLILVGGLVFIISCYFLYAPPVEVSTNYLLICFLAIFLGWTLFEIPHLAWGNVLAPSSKEKSLLFSFRATAGYMGQLLFYCIPLLPLFATREITPETLKFAVTVAALLMSVFLLYSLMTIPDGSHRSIPQGRNDSLHVINQKVISLDRKSGELYKILHFVAKNKPFLLIISSYLILSTGLGMWDGLIFIYVDGYLGMGEKFSQIFILGFVTGILAVPVWYKVSIWLEKKYTLIASGALVAISLIYAQSFAPLQTSLNELAIANSIRSIGLSGMVAILPAILAEVADYGNWKTNGDRTGTCFSLFLFVSKSGNALGVALGLSIAGSYGFDVTIPVNSLQSIWGLKFALIWAPLILIFVTLLLLTRYSISASHHQIIRKAIDRRDMRHSVKKITSVSGSSTKTHTI